jgi:hypothetical protein
MEEPTMTTRPTRYWINDVYSAPTAVYRLRFMPDGLYDETWNTATRKWTMSDKGMYQIAIGDDTTTEVDEATVLRTFPDIEL